MIAAPAVKEISQLPVLQAEDLGVSFTYAGVTKQVIAGLDLSIAAGEFTVIMGPSGAGKSTLLYAISGMSGAQDGRVLLGGENLTALDAAGLADLRRNHCGFVFQQVHLLDHMSVLDNVLIAGFQTKTPRREVVKKAEDLLVDVGLDRPTQDKFPTMLSGGEAQRAAMIRAIINDPAVVFADEPTGALNSESGAKVLDLLSGLHADGQTVVMVTHDVRSALRGDRICYLCDGKIRGELDLGRWHGEDDDRRRRLTDFLTEMGW